MKAPPGFPPGRGFSCFSSLRATGSRERAPDDRLREAIHLTACGGMDCFVADAPRNDGVRLMIQISNSYDSAFPRRNAPEVCINLTLLKKQRAQGKPGARCTRGLACNLHIKKRTRAYRFSGEHPAFPAQWFYGLLRALPGERAFLPPLLRWNDPAQLDASIGASGPHDFAVRVRHVRLRDISVHRIPPRVRDDRDPPLIWVRRAELCH
jgi:hypothetical protein